MPFKTGKGFISAAMEAALQTHSTWLLNSLVVFILTVKPYLQKPYTATPPTLLLWAMIIVLMISIQGSLMALAWRVIYYSVFPHRAIQRILLKLLKQPGK